MTTVKGEIIFFFISNDEPLWKFVGIFRFENDTVNCVNLITIQVFIHTFQPVITLIATFALICVLILSFMLCLFLLFDWWIQRTKKKKKTR